MNPPLYHSDAVQAALERAEAEVVGKPWHSDPVLAQLIDDQLAVSPYERLEQLAVASVFFESAERVPDGE